MILLLPMHEKIVCDAQIFIINVNDDADDGEKLIYSNDSGNEIARHTDHFFLRQRARLHLHPFSFFFLASPSLPDVTVPHHLMGEREKEKKS